MQTPLLWDSLFIKLFKYLVSISFQDWSKMENTPNGTPTPTSIPYNVILVFGMCPMLQW